MNDRYDIQRELGRGGMGAVYLARDRVLEREVALKVLLDASSPEALERFVREARATAGLTHPSIVRTLALNRAGNAVYFTMEAVQGDTLASLLCHGRLPLRDAVRILSEAARGIAAAHERSLVHRDLKPSNLIVESSGGVRILDWGLAKTRSAERGTRNSGTVDGIEEDAALTQAGAVLGTPAYMAPEQALGEPAKIGPLTDVYALGAILYDILTGSAPHRGSLLEIVRALEQGVIEAPRLRAPGREIPRELEAVCLRAMASRPLDRYRSAGRFAEDLESWLSGRTVTACPPSWSVRLARLALRHRVLSAAAVAAILLTAGGSLVLDSAARLEREREDGRREGEILARAREWERVGSLARAALAEAEQAFERWHAALAEYDARLRVEDQEQLEIPGLPVMDEGESLESFLLRTFSALEAFRPPPACGTSTVPARQRVETVASQLEIALDVARRLSRTWVQLGEPSRRPEASKARERVADLGLAHALEDALFQERRELSSSTLAQAPLTAEWRTDPAKVPATFRKVAESLAARLEISPEGSDVSRRAETLLEARSMVEIGEAPPDCEVELYRCCPEQPPGEGAGEVGLELVAQLGPDGFEGPLAVGEYLVRMVRGEREVRRLFVVERESPVRIALEFPAEFPPGTIYVPPGEFQSGSIAAPGIDPHRHRYRLETGFFIQEKNVTWGEYRDFLLEVREREGRIPRELLPEIEGIPGTLPSPFGADLELRGSPEGLAGDTVVVTYPIAASYARWLREASRGRWHWQLPSQLEWEAATRGPAGRMFPWSKSLWRASPPGDPRRDPARAGRPESPYSVTNSSSILLSRTPCDAGSVAANDSLHVWIHGIHAVKLEAQVYGLRLVASGRPP